MDVARQMHLERVTFWFDFNAIQVVIDTDDQHRDVIIQMWSIRGSDKTEPYAI